MKDLDARLRLYGTAESINASRRLASGALSLEITNGCVRNLCWNGTEVLRAIDYPLRNADWGTVSATTVSEHFDERTSEFTYRRDFSVGEGHMVGKFTCSGTASGTVTVALHLRARVTTWVNRAGFVILHPAAGVAGAPLRVTHSNGADEQTKFPTTIYPSQPVLDVAALRQEANGVVANITFTGDVFEMEDQRNWSDASYKTYCRPLALPYPFCIDAGTTLEQTISVELSGAPAARPPVANNVVTIGAPTGRGLPQLAIALETGWEPDPEVRSFISSPATLLRLDITASDWRPTLARMLANSTGQLEVELIASDELAELDAELKALADTGLATSSLTVIPKAWLRSYQPNGPWPPSASPEQAAAIARQRFPNAKIGGGVLTNFTELNRHHAAARAGDFITHGTTAIVHAADDISVLQTLEALPQIFASAETLAMGKPYRLGLVSIGMRSNPYGSEVAANPKNVRRPMAMVDPRQRGLFAAAWAVGAMAATQTSSVERVALAAPSGPFGLFDGKRARPVFYVHDAFVRMGTARRIAVSVPRRTAAVAVEGAMVVANLGEEPRLLSLPHICRVVLLKGLQAAPNWLSLAPREEASTLNLDAYSIAFVLTGSDDVFMS